MDPWQVVVVGIGSAVGVGLLKWLGGELLKWSRRDGAAQIRQIELTAADAFRDDLIAQLAKEREEARRGWERAQMAESQAIRAQSEVWRLQARVEALEARVASLEVENEELRAEKGGSW